MTDIRFENILANFCSPVLMNKKISNLVSISKEEIPMVEDLINDYNESLNKYGISMKPIYQCGNRILVFVYNERALSNHLNKSEVLNLLKKFGYTKEKKLSQFIDKLKIKMKKESFPHEIGLFLGYPLNDVKGFIENNGKNYKFCGYWKVYENEHNTIKLFKLYDAVRKYMLKKISCGESLENILSSFQNKLNIA